MIIRLKNKDTLVLDEFEFKCVIGKGGIRKIKFEGDGSTPKGIFNFGKLYWRKDRVSKPETNLICKPIYKKMGWCDDPNSRLYNKEINNRKKYKSEKLFRRDTKYDYFIVINYNTKKTIKGRGSAIFLHITKNYKKTKGCIAVSKKDFLIISKLINKNSKIKII